MKPIKTKAQIRDEIDRQINEYMNSGGEVARIPNGCSGNATNENLFTNSSEPQPRQERTPLTDVIKALDEKKKRPSTTLTKKHRRPKKKMITDDFGEPVRWVWEDS